jgi:hypothetical protein
MNETKPSAQDIPFVKAAVREALGLPYFRYIPLEAVAAAAAAFEYGANKYEPRNWERGLPRQQLIDSLRRHLDDYERGANYDDGLNGSNLPQVCMIMASAMMLAASDIRNIGEDNRIPADPNTMTGKEMATWISKALERTRKE